MSPRRSPAAARNCSGRTKSPVWKAPLLCAWANASADRSCPKASRIQASGAMTIAAIAVPTCRIPGTVLVGRRRIPGHGARLTSFLRIVRMLALRCDTGGLRDALRRPHGDQDRRRGRASCEGNDNADALDLADFHEPRSEREIEQEGEQDLGDPHVLQDLDVDPDNTPTAGRRVLAFRGVGVAFV